MFYLEGKHNVLADAFSWLHCFDSADGLEGKTPVSVTDPTPLGTFYVDNEIELYDCLPFLPEMDTYYASYDHMLNLPSSEQNPLNFDWKKDTQDADPILTRKVGEAISGFSKHKFNVIELALRKA